jgi:hypothetical protein
MGTYFGVANSHALGSRVESDEARKMPCEKRDNELKKR